MLKLDKFKCLDCDEVFSQWHGSNYHGDLVAICKHCESDNLIKELTAPNFNTSQLLKSKDIPNGFKTLTNEIAKKAGSLNKIETTGIGEI